MNDDLETALHLGVSSGNLYVVELLLAAGSYVRRFSNFYSPPTPLEAAASEGEEEMMRVLLKPELKKGKWDPYVFHELALSEEAGAVWAARILLEGGVNDNARNPICRESLLVMAAKAGGAGMVQLPSEFGADTGDVSPDGKTALHYAREAGHAEVAAIIKNAMAKAPAHS